MNTADVDPLAADRRANAWRRGAWIVAGAALAAILGAAQRTPGIVDAWTLLHWFAKPLATFTLAVLVALRASSASDRLRRAVLAGLLFSLAGDVLLMLSPKLFVGGLVAFLAAHLCYLRAFTVDTRRFADRRALVVLVVLGAAVVAVLWDGLPAALKAPVLAYVVVLVAMAAQAFARWREHPSPVTQAAAIGAALFVVSDAVLAIDRFHARVPVASLWILVTYWLAQWGIAQSVRETPPTADAPLPGAAPSDAPRREAVSPAAHPQSTGRERMR